MPSNRTFNSRITFAISLFTLFATSKAFYVNTKNIYIDSNSNKNFTDVPYGPIDDENSLVVNNEKNASNGFINLLPDYSTESNRMKEDPYERSIGLNEDGNGTVNLNVSKLFPRKEVGAFKYSKNDKTNTNIDNTTNEEFVKRNAKTDSKIVYKLERSEDRHVAPTVKGNVANDAEAAGDATPFSYQSKTNNSTKYVPYASTDSIPKIEEGISGHVDHMTNSTNKKHNSTLKNSYEFVESLRKKGESNDLPLMKAQLLEDKKENRLAKNQKLPKDYEETVTKEPAKLTTLEIFTRDPLSSTQRYKYDKHFELHMNDHDNEKVPTAAIQMMPELLTALLPARSYVAFTDVDLPSTELPKIQAPKPNVPALPDALGTIKLSEKSIMTVLQIYPEDFPSEINASQIETRANSHPSNNANNLDNTQNRTMELSNDAISEKSSINNSYEHSSNRLEINAEEKETMGNIHLQSHGNKQTYINKDQIKNSPSTNGDVKTIKEMFTPQNNTLNQNLLAIEQKQTSSAVIDDSLKKNIPEKSNVYNTTKFEIATIDYYENHINKSFKANYSRLRTKNTGFTNENLGYDSKDSPDVLKPEGIRSPTIENFKDSMRNSSFSQIETNTDVNKNAESDSRKPGGYDLNDELTSETQIVPTVYTIGDISSSKSPQDVNIPNKHENDTIRHFKEEYHNTVKEFTKPTFDVPKIAPSKNTIDVHNKTKVANLYPVSPNYRRFKKLEVSSPKPFRRDPNDNTWRNQSISSLGIVFKAKANASKPLTVVLKNKTDTDLGVANGKENRTELELRQRLEKLSELRKSKKKLAKPTTESYQYKEQKPKQMDKIIEHATSIPILATTSTMPTGLGITTSTVKNTFTSTVETIESENTTPAVFTATPRPFKITAQRGPQKVVLIVKKANNENLMYYDTVESLAPNDESEFIAWNVWNAGNTPHHHEHLRPDSRRVPAPSSAQFYLPPKQTQKHHDNFEERLYTAVNVAATNSLRKRSKNSIERWAPVNVYGGEHSVVTPRSPAALSVISRGNDYGEVSYAINHDAPSTEGRRTSASRSHPYRHVEANAVHPSRAIRNEEDYDYHDRLQLTDLEKFSFTYNSERFTGDVPILFDTGVVRVDVAPYRQLSAEKEDSAPTASTESGADGATDSPSTAPASRAGTVYDRHVPPLRSYEVNPFGTFFFGQDDE